MSTSFQICIKCCDGRDSGPIQIHFVSLEQFQNWLFKIRENFSENIYLTAEDLNLLEQRAVEHFTQCNNRKNCNTL